MINKPFLYVFGLVALGLAFYFPFLGSVHLFDWDEINFAESAREMIVTGDYTKVQINFEPFWEKPPLFFWLQVLAMKVFGVNEFAARFPNAVFGIITLLSLYFIGKKLYDREFGFIWAIAYLGSFLPHLYFKSGIIDPVFNYFIFLSIFFLSRAIHFYGKKGATKLSIISGVFIGLAILTKGPVGLLILLITLFVIWVLNRFHALISFKNLVLFGLFAGIVSFAWFGLEMIKNGPWFLQEFITYQIRLLSTHDAGHKQPFFYHFVVLLVGCFPLSIFAIRSFYNKDRQDDDFNKRLRIWMIILFWVVLILFTIVQTKIVHYSSMAYFPLSYLAAYHLYRLYKGKWDWRKMTAFMTGLFGFIIALALAIFPFVGMYKEKLIPYIKDKFAVGNLEAEVYWGGWEGLIGIGYFLAIIVALVYFKNKKVKKAIGTLFISTAVALGFYSAIVVPKIELYTQAAPIRFYESLKGQDVYIHVVGFKSYAHLFYFDKQPVTNPKSNEKEWLLTGEIDKDAYFVTKITKMEEMKQYRDVKLIKVENGFAFYKRTPRYYEAM